MREEDEEQRPDCYNLQSPSPFHCCRRESPMEFMGQPKTFGAGSLLEVPGLSPVDVDDDEGEVVINIRPKSSPLPRRRSSSDSDSEPEPPLSGSRRVSFADAKGLSLVQVKEFETWNIPKLPGYSSSEGEGIEAEEYFLSPLTFCPPLSTEELFTKVRDQKVELETIDLLPGTTILKGVIRVLNVSFDKAVYIRTTLDSWASHFDLLAEYIPGSGDGLMDCFSFKLTLVPPFGEEGARVDFCLRYETPVGTFWANNNNRNYVLFCRQKRKDKPHTETVNKKSCLKTVSQHFSEENISAEEASSQENIPADVSNHAGEVNSEKDKQISEENQQKIQAENRRNSSRRSRRKAARMARVRDYFAQRDGGASDTKNDKEAKQEVQEESPKEEHSDGQPFSEDSRKSQLSPSVSESLEMSSKSSLSVSLNVSPGHDSSNSKPEKSESGDLASLTTSTGGESAAVIPASPLLSNDEPALLEHQNINKSNCKAEGGSQKQGVCCEGTDDTAAGPADSVISAVISESLASPTSSFTFGTVVAPLYHQMFGRVGSESQSESQSVGDRGNPTLNTGDLPQSFTQRQENSCTFLTDVRNNNDKGQVKEIKIQESNQDASPNTPPTEEQETGSSVTADDILDHTETLQHPGEMTESDQRLCTNTSEDTEVHPHAVNVLHTDLLSAQIATQSLCLQGESQEDGLTCDLQNQTTVETAQAQLSENTCSQIKANVDKNLSQTEAEGVTASRETSPLPPEPPLSGSQHVNDETEQQAAGENDFECAESKKEDDTGKTISISTAGVSFEADHLLGPLHDLNLNQRTFTATKETAGSFISSCETVEENDFSTHETCPETNDTVEELSTLTNNLYEDETKHSAEIEASGDEAGSMMKAMISENRIHDDMFVESNDKDTLKEKTMVLEEIEHHEMEAAVLKQEDFSLADTTEEKNWEMMVEEEEKNILTDQEESDAINLKADTETADKDQGGQMEDAVLETALENTDTTEREEEKTQEEVVEELTCAGENRTKAEDAVGSDDKDMVGEGDVLEKKMKDVEKQSEHVQATETKKTFGVEGVAEEREEQEEADLKEEKYSVEMQEVNAVTTNLQEEEEIEGQEKMEIDLTDGDDASVVRGDQVNPRGENIEEEISDYKEEILVDKAGEFVDAGSEGRAIEDGGDEVGCCEERLDITQNKVEDGLSAPVNTVQDKGVIDKENTRKGENAGVPTEKHLYKEEDFQSSENVTHDRSKAENESLLAHGHLCVLTDEPESDQTSHDSASTDSDSDDEVELYMHCLRAVHAGAQASKDKNKDPGFSVSKRPSVSRSKLLSTPMPSISESLDEEPASCPQDAHQDLDTADFQPAAAAPSLSGQESTHRNVSWWRETFSWSNISNTLLYTTLLVVFMVVAYHYDFLACFGLYLISVVWLYCQGDRQPVKNNNKMS